jgi:hypothetical protein
MMSSLRNWPRTVPNSCELASGDQPKFLFLLVGGTGIEPVAPAV